jgi:ribosomal protein S12 methylthiotransferase
VDNQVTASGKPGSVMGLRRFRDPIEERTMRDHDRPPTVALVTLGCGRNEVDSENVAGMLSASGFRMVADPERADAVIVNTCAFIEAAKRESIDTILAAADLKEQGAARAVLVTGCMAQRYTAALREQLPEADAVVPFADYSRLPDLLRSRLGNGHGAAGDGVAGGPVPVVGPAAEGVVGGPVVGAAAEGATGLVPTGRRALPLVFPTPAGEAFPARPVPRGPVALVKLAEGCDRDCSFCAIPSFRGRFRSRRPTEVIEEVAWLASHGVSEVGLVAENSTSYGKDLGGREALIHLLRDLAGIDGLRRVRLNYLQPDEITPGLLEEMAANPVVSSYFDLSLQHVSEPVLRRMRRGGSVPVFLDLIERIRSLDPDAAFRSNFILGFPGERQADVRQLEEFLEAAHLDWVAFFAYSGEDGTAALALDGRVPGRTARRRVERLQELQARVLDAAQAAWIGRRVEVLVERVESDGTAEGRSFREGIDSDGIVRVEGADAGVGEYLQVEIVAAEGPELLARPVRG